MRGDALHYYNGLGTRILSNVTAVPFADPRAGTAGVTVSGKLNSLLNMFGGTTVTVTVQGPQECFHPVTAGGGCTQ